MEAVVQTTHTNAVGVALTESVMQAKQALRRWSAYASTRNELRSLSDRELADIGMSRAMIDGVAREAAARA